MLIWAQATLLSVSMMSIPSAQNSPRFCCNVRLMTLSSIGIPRRERSAGAPLAERSCGMKLRLRRGRFGLRRLVADQADFAQQLRHLYPRERFEERGHLRGNLRDVAGELVCARSVAIACS